MSKLAPQLSMICATDGFWTELKSVRTRHWEKKSTLECLSCVIVLQFVVCSLPGFDLLVGDARINRNSYL